LRQLAVVLLLLAIPAVAILAVALGDARLLLKVIFHHEYTTTASALAPLVIAMIVLSVSVIITMYLLAIGRRWVVGVLIAGAGALSIAVATMHGRPRATALVDLAVQAGVLAVLLAGFTVVHWLRVGAGRHSAAHRQEAANAGPRLT
jgi:hypothetical protein